MINSIEVQSSGDSSHPYPTEGLEPGTSLANVLAERIFSMHSNERIQPVSSRLSNTDSERQSLNDLDNMKYKTELCRNYSAYGFCSYASRCQFAHGLEDLRCRTRHPKYKTEFCRNFLSGFCKYGSRCQFLHDSHNTNETVPPKDNLTTLDPTAVAALGTYLLTNMLGHSVTFGLGRPLTHLSVLDTLASYANLPSKPTSAEYSSKRSTIPLHCGIEMQQVSPLHLSPNLYHGISIPQNQNNNDSQLSYTTPRMNRFSETNPSAKQNTLMKRTKNSSTHP